MFEKILPVTVFLIITFLLTYIIYLILKNPFHYPYKFMRSLQ